MLKVMASVWLALRFVPVMATLDICRPVPVPQGVLPVKGAEGLALSAIKNAEEGILLPAPSVSAVVLLK